MSTTLRRPVSALALVFQLAALAVADVVTLSDGSRLLGTVERMQDGKLVLVTKFAGTLEIDASMVTTIQTDQPVNVGMTTGDRLVGPIEWKPQVECAVVQTEMGGVPISLEKVSAIWPRDGKSPEVLALEEQIAEVKRQAEEQQAKWRLVFEAGLFFAEGNNDVLRASGRAEALRQSPRDQLKFYLSGEYSEENDRRSTHEVKGGTYYEYLFTQRWFAYWRLDLEYDEFENLDLRLSTVAGPGFYLIKRPEHELKARAGMGYLHESFMDGLTRNVAQAEIGLDYRLDITPWMQFTNSTTWYPTFESVRDYRIVSDSALLFPLADSEVWKLKLGALYEYDSIPNPGFERLDQTYTASVVAELK